MPPCVKSASGDTAPLTFFPPGERAKGSLAKQPLIKTRSKIMKIFTLFVAFTLVCFALSPSAQGVVPPPPGAIPTSPLLRGTTPFRLSPWALGTQQLVRFRCLASPLATSTPLLALERLILTPRIQIRPLALQRFCLTPPAQKTRPMEQPRLNLTTTGNNNTATGAFALFSNISGNGNTANGWHGAL